LIFFVLFINKRAVSFLQASSCLIVEWSSHIYNHRNMNSTWTYLSQSKCWYHHTTVAMKGATMSMVLK
jgi:hypothetical protein